MRCGLLACCCPPTANPAAIIIISVSFPPTRLTITTTFCSPFFFFFFLLILNLFISREDHFEKPHLIAFLIFQCDEGHPVCRNCVKSKRDCLGYDPVFRTQSTTPSAIQPAPNNPAPPPPPSLVVAPQQEPGPYPAAPPGYVPAVSQPFAPSLQSESSAPSSTEHNQFDYSATIDPALEGNNNSGNMASVQHATSAPDGGFQAPLNAGASGMASPPPFKSGLRFLFD